MRRKVSALLLLGFLVLVVSDVSFRFDRERVEAKRQNQSAQRHWSPFYLQDYTYDDGPFKYRHDIDNIRGLLEPNRVLLSDKASSYYVAAELPVFVRNVHAHHYRKTEWNRIIGQFYLCYIDQEESYNNVKNFIDSQAVKTRRESQPEFKYWLINRDSSNLNLRRDCLATRGAEIASGLQKLGELIYQGEYLDLYQIN